MGIFKNGKDAIDHMTASLNSARNGESKLLEAEEEFGTALLKIFGMSGVKWRHFLNNLMSAKDVSYLEIGSHSGSTFCSAIYKNRDLGHAQTIDNWAQFGNKKKVLVDNIGNTMLKSDFAKDKIIKVTESDFYEYDYSKIPGEVDVYFFDGPHKEKFQYDGVKIVFDHLADIFILLVDDWNWGGPRRGTEKALLELDVNVLHQTEIYTGGEYFDPKTGKINRFQNSDWHNGVAIFVCEKINQ